MRRRCAAPSLLTWSSVRNARSDSPQQAHTAPYRWKHSARARFRYARRFSGVTPAVADVPRRATKDTPTQCIYGAARFRCCCRGPVLGATSGTNRRADVGWRQPGGVERLGCFTPFDRARCSTAGRLRKLPYDPSRALFRRKQLPVPSMSACWGRTGPLADPACHHAAGCRWPSSRWRPTQHPRRARRHLHLVGSRVRPGVLNGPHATFVYGHVWSRRKVSPSFRKIRIWHHTCSRLYFPDSVSVRAVRG